MVFMVTDNNVQVFVRRHWAKSVVTLQNVRVKLTKQLTTVFVMTAMKVMVSNVATLTNVRGHHVNGTSPVETKMEHLNAFVLKDLKTLIQLART